MKKSRIRSSGFTLVELLVVIAIIGILVGMLLPAVQQVREAARRSACQNNLKQLALGCHNFESAYMHLPSTGTKAFDQLNRYAANISVGFEMQSWGFQILPFIEKNNIVDAWDSGSPVIGPIWRIDKHVIPAYACPSRGQRYMYHLGDKNPATDYASYVSTWSAGSYASEVYNGVYWATGSATPHGFFGYTETSDRASASEKNGSVYNGAIAKRAHVDPSQGGRVSYDFGKVGMELADGTSNTLLLAEKSASARHYDVDTSEGGGPGVGSLWRFNDNHGAMGGYNPNNHRTWGGIATGLLADSTIRKLSSLPDDDAGIREWEFGSPHPGTINAAIADGSVRAISMQTDVVAWYKIGNREDGGIISWDEY